MRKLLHANTKRVLMSKLYWGEMIVWLLYCIGYQLDTYHSAVRYGFPPAEIFQQTLFSFTMFMGIFFSVFVSLFIGTEYSDGTIRNKLIVGRTRNSIYLSDYITCAAAGIVQTAMAAAVYLTIGFLMFGSPGMEGLQILQMMAVMLFLCLSYAAVYTFVSMLSNSKAHASIINILIAAGMLLAAAYLSGALAAPETITDYRIVNGVMEVGEQMQNPSYITGLKRAVYQFLLDFLPGGQNMELAQSSLIDHLLKHPALSCFYSAIIVAVLNTAGMLLFRRKDIK